MLELLYSTPDGEQAIYGEAFVFDGPDLYRRYEDGEELVGVFASGVCDLSREHGGPLQLEALALKPCPPLPGEILPPILALDDANGALVARETEGFRLLFARDGVRLADFEGWVARSSCLGVDPAGASWAYGSALETRRLVIAEASYFAANPVVRLTAFTPGNRSRASALAEKVRR